MMPPQPGMPLTRPPMRPFVRTTRWKPSPDVDALLLRDLGREEVLPRLDGRGGASSAAAARQRPGVEARAPRSAARGGTGTTTTSHMSRSSPMASSPAAEHARRTGSPAVTTRTCFRLRSRDIGTIADVAGVASPDASKPASISPPALTRSRSAPSSRRAPCARAAVSARVLAEDGARDGDHRGVDSEILKPLVTVAAAERVRHGEGSRRSRSRPRTGTKAQSTSGSPPGAQPLLELDVGLALGHKPPRRGRRGPRASREAAGANLRRWREPSARKRTSMVLLCTESPRRECCARAGKITDCFWRILAARFAHGARRW